jgi:hypothetical protein
MILLLAFLLQDVPPPPSGRPLPRDAVEILDPIAPAVGRYDDCLMDTFQARHPAGIANADAHRRAMDEAIAKCADVRRSAVAEAERKLAEAPDYKDPVRRELAIRHAFEGTERMRREFVAMSEAGVLPGQDRPPVPSVVVPEGAMPAVMDYMRCLTAGMNAAARERIADREQRRARAAGVDRDCRAHALGAVPEIFDGRVRRRNEAVMAALNAAMDGIGGSVVTSFVDPESTIRRDPPATAAKPRGE